MVDIAPESQLAHACPALATAATGATGATGVTGELDCLADGLPTLTVTLQHDVCSRAGAGFVPQHGPGFGGGCTGEPQSSPSEASSCVPRRPGPQPAPELIWALSAAERLLAQLDPGCAWIDMLSSTGAGHCHGYGCEESSGPDGSGAACTPWRTIIGRWT